MHTMNTAVFILAITLFATLYGALHFYAYQKLAPLLSRRRWPVGVALALLAASIFITVALSHNNLVYWFVEPMALVSFSWMGAVFLFFSISVPLDALAWAAGKTGRCQIHAGLVSPRRTMVVCVAVLLVGVYGHLASKRFEVEKLSFASSKIKTPLRIAQISDLHLGILSEARYFQNVVDTINNLDADLIVCTGDLVDMQMDHLDGLGQIMSRLKSRMGKFAVYGNHEALAGIEASRRFTQRIGFTILSNSGAAIDKLINVVGVDDPTVARARQDPGLNEQALLKQYDNGLFTILLKHRPSVETASAGLFDLQLSGHTHGGQIFPFGLLIRLFYRTPFGLTQYGSHQWLYVSRGTGTWGPPMRVLAPAEITLIQLQPMKNS